MSDAVTAEQTFEQVLERLKTLVATLDRRESGLLERVDMLEAVISCHRQLLARVTAPTGKLELLKKNESGVFESAPFSPPDNPR